MTESKKPLKLTPNAWVADIPDYTPGKHKGQGTGPLVVLSANENPLGSSPAVEAVKKIANHRYPDSLAVKLKNTIAEFYGVPANSISCGAGSDEVLQAIAKTFLSVGSSAIYSRYGFLVYPIAIKAMGARAVVAEETKNAEGNFQTDLPAILSLVDKTTKAVFIANPNNPTGTMVTMAAIEDFLQKLPSEILLVLDVAYAEYVADENYSRAVMMLTQKFPNLVVVRTFSKIYGLASLRLGFCHGDERVIRLINKLCNVFNTSQIAQDAGVVAMGDQQFVAQSHQHNLTERQRVLGVLRQHGYTAYDSETNFYLIYFGDKELANSFLQFMESHNVFVRGMTSYHLPEYIRVTVGTREENDIFLQWAGAWRNQQG